jgi:hypothetical protein
MDLDEGTVRVMARAVKVTFSNNDKGNSWGFSDTIHEPHERVEPVQADRLFEPAEHEVVFRQKLIIAAGGAEDGVQAAASSA